MGITFFWTLFYFVVMIKKNTECTQNYCIASIVLCASLKIHNAKQSTESAVLEGNKDKKDI